MLPGSRTGATQTESRAVWPLRGEMFTNGSIRFRKHLAGLARDESGQAIVEYGLILALVSLAAIGLSPFGQAIAQVFNDIALAI